MARRARRQGGAALQRPRAQGKVAGGDGSAPWQVLRRSCTAGPRAGGSSGRLGLRRRQCPRDGAVQRQRHRDGSAGWSRPRPAGAAAGSGSATMEPAPSGATGALPLWDPLSPLLLTRRLSSAAAAATPKRPRAASTVLGAAPTPPAAVPSWQPGTSALRGSARGRRAGVPRDLSVRRRGPRLGRATALSPGRASRSGCRPAGAVVLGSTGWKGEKAAGAECARRILARGEPWGPALRPAAWGESRLGPGGGSAGSGGPGGRGSPGCSRPPLKHVWA